MYPPSPPPSPLEEVDRQEGELRALERLLHVSKGTSSLCIAICNDPSLKKSIIDTVEIQEHQVAVVELPPQTVDVFGHVQKTLKDYKPGAIFVTNLEHSIASGDSYPAALRSLNASRDLWRTEYLCPVVFWIPEFIAALLPTVAPDLWRFKSHTFEFVASPLDNRTEVEIHMAGDLMLAGSLTKSEKLFRITELQQRLLEAGTSPSLTLLPHVRQWTNELAFLYEELGRLDEAKGLRTQALEFERGQGNTEVQAVHLGNLGLIEWRRGELDKAEQLLYEALKLNQECKDLKRVAVSIGNLAGIAHQRGDIEAAQALHRQALEASRQLGDAMGEARQLGNLGIIAWRRGEHKEAEHLLRQALSISETHDDLKSQAIALGNLGVVQEAYGNVTGAEESYKNALQLDRLLGRLDGQASNLGNLGVLAARSGQIKEAEKYMLKSLRIHREIGSPQGVALDLLNLGGLAEEMKKYKLAVQRFKESRDIYLQLGLQAQADQVEKRILRHFAS